MAVKHYRLTGKHELPVKITMKIQENSKYMYVDILWQYNPLCTQGTTMVKFSKRSASQRIIKHKMEVSWR